MLRLRLLACSPIPVREPSSAPRRRRLGECFGPIPEPFIVRKTLSPSTDEPINFFTQKSRLQARTRGDLDIRLTQLIVTVTHDEVAKVDADEDVVAIGLMSDSRDVRSKLLPALQQATVFGQLAPSNKKDFPSRLGHVRAHLESWRGQLALWVLQVH